LGSGRFSGDLLNFLLDNGLHIHAVITRPDQPAGRGLRPRPTAVKTVAEERGLPLFQPHSLPDEMLVKQLVNIKPDFFLVADYGIKLPQDILDLPLRGCLNVHPSLLPRYRGPAPIQRALMDGVKITGVTMMLMDEGLDTGPIVAQSQIEVSEDANAGFLEKELARLAAYMIPEVMRGLISGELVPHLQDESQATYAEAVRKSEACIDWSLDNRRVHNLIRALSPTPGAYTYYRNKRIKILRSKTLSGGGSLKPGEIGVEGKEVMLAGTGEGDLILEVLQPQGKNTMSAGEFLRGYRPREGETFSNTPLTP